MARRRQQRYEEDDVWEDGEDFSRDAEGDEHEKAPLLLRVLTWVGVVLLCFVGGYLGTSWGIKLLNQEGLLAQQDVVKNNDELNKFIEQDNAQRAAAKKPDQIDAKISNVTLYYPNENSLASEPLNVVVGLREEEIDETLKKLFLLSEMFPKEVIVKHIFRNASVLFLDVAGPFIPMLAQAGKDRSALFITGLVRTMKENFAPVTEVRFLVNGAVTTAGSPVDLTAAWSLPQ